MRYFTVLFILIFSVLPVYAQETPAPLGLCGLREEPVGVDAFNVSSFVIELVLAEPLMLIGGVEVNANVRSGPATYYSIQTALQAQSNDINLIGRNADGSWLRLASVERQLWVYAPLITGITTEDIEALPVLDKDTLAAPLFIELSDFDEDALDCAPFILLQTEDEPSQIVFNEATYALQPQTALLVIPTEDFPLVLTVSGEARIHFMDEQFSTIAGTQFQFHAEDNAVVTPYTGAIYTELNDFGFDFEVSPAIEQDVLEQFLRQAAAPVVVAPVQSSTTGTTTTSAPPANPTEASTAATTGSNRVVVNPPYSIGITSVPGGGRESVIGEVQPGVGGTVLESQFVGCCTFYRVAFDTGDIGWTEQSYLHFE
jgi:hypothetical protein